MIVCTRAAVTGSSGDITGAGDIAGASSGASVSSETPQAGPASNKKDIGIKE